MTKQTREADPILLPVVLDALGWKVHGEKPGIAKAWYPEQAFEQKNFEYSPYIIVPFERGITENRISREEYNSLIDRAYSYLRYKYSSFDTIYEFEKINQSESLDLISNKADTGTKSGLVSLQEGEQLFSATRELLISSAKAADRHQPYFGNAASVVAKEVVSKSYFGQTQVGGYVVTAYVPSCKKFAISKASDGNRKSKNQKISGREITNSMSVALKTLNESIEEAKASSHLKGIFNNSVESGVSFELIGAVTHMLQAGPTVKAITISIKIKSKPQAEKTKTQVYEFKTEDLLILNKAKQILRDNNSYGDATKAGKVLLKRRSSKAKKPEIKLPAKRYRQLNQAKANMYPQQVNTVLQARQSGKQL